MAWVVAYDEEGADGGGCVSGDTRTVRVRVALSGKRESATI